MLVLSVGVLLSHCFGYASVVWLVAIFVFISGACFSSVVFCL
jgi:hypothetical protein